MDAFVLMSSCTLYLLDDLLPFLHTGSCSKCSQKICDYCSLFVAAKDSFMMKYLISEDFHAQGIMAGRQLVAIFGFLLLVLTSPPKADAGVNTYIESIQEKGKIISSFLSLGKELCFSMNILCLRCKC